MHGNPAAHPNRRFAQSPVDALIGLIVGCGLRRQIPVWLDVDTLAHLRITLIPQRWPACRGAGDMRGACESTPMWSRIFLICAPSPALVVAESTCTDSICAGTACAMAVKLARSVCKTSLAGLTNWAFNLHHREPLQHEVQHSVSQDCGGSFLRVVHRASPGHFPKKLGGRGILRLECSGR